MKKKIVLSGVTFLIIFAIVLGIFTYTEKSNAKAKKENEAKLIEAIATGEIKQVKELVSDKNTSLAANKQGVTPLDLAIMNQDYKIASVLLEHGADISSNSNNPLFVTLVFSIGDPDNQESYKEARDMFLAAIKNHKDKLDDTNGRGNTALHIAALRGVADVVALLMAEGLDPSHPNSEGETPVYIASQEGHTEVITQLAEHDPELLKVKDHGGNTIITAAVINMRAELLDMLLGKVPGIINEQNNEGKTALIYASEYGEIELVKKLLKAGADPSIKDQENKSAAMWAKEWGHTEIVNLLEN